MSVNVKVAGFALLTLGIFGAALSHGFVTLPSLAAGSQFSKAACVKSVAKQADKNLLLTTDPEQLCGCFADLNLTRDTAKYETVKPCLDKYLKEPIINSCERDEAEKAARRNKQNDPNELPDENAAPVGPDMNCECVYNRASEWVWHNFDLGMRNKTVTTDEAGTYANSMINECKWK